MFSCDSIETLDVAFGDSDSEALRRVELVKWFFAAISVAEAAQSEEACSAIEHAAQHVTLFERDSEGNITLYDESPENEDFFVFVNSTTDGYAPKFAKEAAITANSRPVFSQLSSPVDDMLRQGLLVLPSFELFSPEWAGLMMLNSLNVTKQSERSEDIDTTIRSYIEAMKEGYALQTEVAATLSDSNFDKSFEDEAKRLQASVIGDTFSYQPPQDNLDPKMYGMFGPPQSFADEVTRVIDVWVIAQLAVLKGFSPEDRSTFIEIVLFESGLVPTLGMFYTEVEAPLTSL